MSHFRLRPGFMQTLDLAPQVVQEKIALGAQQQDRAVVESHRAETEGRTDLRGTLNVEP
jgi:hypothetical protein